MHKNVWQIIFDISVKS